MVRVDGKLAGLVLVRKGAEVSGNEAVWDIAEFFIVRGWRRRGVGTQVAHEIWRRFPGSWEVRVMRANTTAQEFWAQAIALFPGQVIHPLNIERAGDFYVVFTFQSEGLKSVD